MKQIIFILAIALSIVSCTPKQAPKDKEVPAVMVEATLQVNGMTCTECEQSVATGVNTLAGIDSISANHLDSTAFVRFDSNKTNLHEIKKAIEGRGYEVVASAK
jgi:copper chaperone CopZ